MKTLYSFCSAPGCIDGNNPHGKLVFDSLGNLYGTTLLGGSNCQKNGAGGCGTVFQLSPSQGGVWVESALYSFCAGDIQNCPDGSAPSAGLIFDKSGNLFGTTKQGGTFGLGTVFKLSPPFAPGEGAWTETVLWSFGATGDGQSPISSLAFDPLGNLYGTTSQGGAYGYGTVFQLVPPPSGGQWSESLMYSFGLDPFNGGDLRAGVTLDSSGNLYGATYEGGSKTGSGLGVVYKLSPFQQLPWTETVLFRFTKKSGGNPTSDVYLDKNGNVYGTTTAEAAGHGSVFRLTPEGGGRVNVVPFFGKPDGNAPRAGVLIVGSTIYGTTSGGGSQNLGTIFKIQGTKETVLDSFCSQPACADGLRPDGVLIFRNRSLFGTASDGGANGNGGVVFQISMPAPQRAKATAKNNARAAKIHQVTATHPTR